MQPPKRDGGVLPSPVNLAEWVNAGFCPQEALHEAGLLFLDTDPTFVQLRVEFGPNVSWDNPTDMRLEHVDVNADSIDFRWRDYSFPKPSWNSIPLAKRAAADSFLLKVGFPRGGSNSSPKLRKLDAVTSLDDLARRWNDTPVPLRPAHFPLDPVVGAKVGGRVSLGDYLPTFRRYQKAVRLAVERDKEKNGQDARNVLSPDSEKHDVLIGLLRAGADSLVEKRVREGIAKLIPKLGMLDDVNHGRVEKALEYAIGSKRSNSKNWRRSYDKARRAATKRAGG